MFVLDMSFCEVVNFLQDALSLTGSASSCLLCWWVWPFMSFDIWIDFVWNLPFTCLHFMSCYKALHMIWACVFVVLDQYLLYCFHAYVPSQCKHPPCVEIWRAVWVTLKHFGDYISKIFFVAMRLSWLSRWAYCVSISHPCIINSDWCSKSFCYKAYGYVFLASV